jgi:hypothetical protein
LVHRGFVVVLLLVRLDGVLTTGPLGGGLVFLGDASMEVIVVRVDFRRLIGGGDSTVANTSSSSSASICRVIRRLFLFLFVEIVSSLISTPESLRERVVVVGSDFTDFVGDDAFEGGNEPLSPTKNGQVGVLLLCSSLYR